MLIDIKAPPGFTLKPGHEVGIHTANGGGCCAAVYDENGEGDFSETLRLWEYEDFCRTLPGSDPRSTFHGFWKLGKEMAAKRGQQILDLILNG